MHFLGEQELFKKITESKPFRKLGKPLENWVIPIAIILVLLYMAKLHIAIDSQQGTIDQQNQQIDFFEHKLQSLNQDLETEMRRLQDCRQQRQELESRVRELEEALDRTLRNDTSLMGIEMQRDSSQNDNDNVYGVGGASRTITEGVKGPQR